MSYVHIYGIIHTKEMLPETESKIGGLPYLPIGGALPLTEKGNVMRLLAQINCEDESFRSAVEQVMPDFPTQGILQFFIAQDSDLYGLNDGFQVVYHPVIEKHYANEDVLAIYANNTKNENQSVHWEYGMPFFWCNDSDASPANFEIRFKLKNNIDFIDSKVGGTPDFIQNDIRESEYNGNQYTELILQIESMIGEASKKEKVGHIMWWDWGVANFFMRKEDLKKRNFDRVLYNWDCY